MHTDCDCIILAGGFGTRLRGVVSDRPKPLALVGDRPFLSILLDMLAAQKIENVVLAVGYKGEMIEDYYADSYKNIRISYSYEESPLGTGGAVKQALEHCHSGNILILNGDTYLKMDLNDMLQAHLRSGADVSIAVKEMEDVSRYGSVVLDGKRIVAFKEKAFYRKSLINGGIYCFKRKTAALFPEKASFSLERDFFEISLEQLYIGAYVTGGYFIDIGVPEDYERAQSELT